MTKTLAGEQPRSLPEIRVAMRRGLPLIIPGSLRLEIEARNKGIIKLVLTLLAIFRVIPCFPKLKLATITDPFKGVNSDLPELTLVFE
jgi:hypothetical protein